VCVCVCAEIRKLNIRMQGRDWAVLELTERRQLS